MSPQFCKLAIGIPTLNRYDCLKRLLDSLDASTLLPTEVVIIDNGFQIVAPPAAEYDATGATAAISNGKVWEAVGSDRPYLVRVAPIPHPLGLAASWNRLIEECPEPRLLTNDDIVFGPTALEAILSIPADVVAPLARANAFSCFTLSDHCLEVVGMFDETISPGYAYFEDDDYAKRMALAGIPITSCDTAPVEHLHGGSSTLKAFTPAELQAHHAKFCTARDNFVRKWGHLPNQD